MRFGELREAPYGRPYKVAAPTCVRLSTTRGALSGKDYTSLCTFFFFITDYVHGRETQEGSCTLSSVTHSCVSDFSLGMEKYNIVFNFTKKIFFNI